MEDQFKDKKKIKTIIIWSVVGLVIFGVLIFVIVAILNANKSNNTSTPSNSPSVKIAQDASFQVIPGVTQGYLGCFSTNHEQPALTGGGTKGTWSDPMTLPACLQIAKNGNWNFYGVQGYDQPSNGICWVGNNTDYNINGTSTYCITDNNSNIVGDSTSIAVYKT